MPSKEVSMKKVLAPLILGTIVLGGCTLAMPEAPMNPMVETKKPGIDFTDGQDLDPVFSQKMKLLIKTGSDTSESNQ